MERTEVLKVSTRSRPSAVAGAIAGVLRDRGMRRGPIDWRRRNQPGDQGRGHRTRLPHGGWVRPLLRPIVYRCDDRRRGTDRHQAGDPAAGWAGIRRGRAGRRATAARLNWRAVLARPASRPSASVGLCRFAAQSAQRARQAFHVHRTCRRPRPRRPLFRWWSGNHGACLVCCPAAAPSSQARAYSKIIRRPRGYRFVRARSDRSVTLRDGATRSIDGRMPRLPRRLRSAARRHTSCQPAAQLTRDDHTNWWSTAKRAAAVRVGDLQLAIDRLEMGLHRPPAHLQSLGDHVVGQPFGDQPQHLDLARREAGRIRRFAARTDGWSHWTHCRRLALRVAAARTRRPAPTPSARPPPRRSPRPPA